MKPELYNVTVYLGTMTRLYQGYTQPWFTYLIKKEEKKNETWNAKLGTVFLKKEEDGIRMNLSCCALSLKTKNKKAKKQNKNKNAKKKKKAKTIESYREGKGWGVAKQSSWKVSLRRSLTLSCSCFDALTLPHTLSLTCWVVLRCTVG